jgi:hypothetical protein
MSDDTKAAEFGSGSHPVDGGDHPGPGREDDRGGWHGLPEGHRWDPHTGEGWFPGAWRAVEGAVLGDDVLRAIDILKERGLISPVYDPDRFDLAVVEKVHGSL